MVFLPWLADLDMVGCKIGFYVENCVYSRLETPGNCKISWKAMKMKESLGSIPLGHTPLGIYPLGNLNLGVMPLGTPLGGIPQTFLVVRE